MRVSMPKRPYRAYAFVQEGTEIEREPSWEIGFDDKPVAKTRIHMISPVLPGIYGFHSAPARDTFVRQCNQTEKYEIAFPCSLNKPL
jgi:hypothetical protein